MEDSTIKLIIAVLGVPLGLLTYYFTKLWMEPYFEYEKLKAKINADFVYFANAIEIDMKNTECFLYEKYLERCDSFRRYASDLLALYPLLPSWHRIHNWESEENPQKAVGELLKYANSPLADRVRDAEAQIRTLLKLPTIPS